MPAFDTIAALATPAGRSALATIRVSGPQVPQLVFDIFHTTTLTPKQAFISNYHSIKDETLDNVVYIYYKAPSSFTGEHLLELSCHGNPLIINVLLTDLWQRGCRAAEPGEFTKTAFLNGKLDLTQAEAVQELIQATSERALNIAQKQLKGSISKKIEAWLQELIGLIAHLEAYIDFPEEDLPAEDSKGPIKTLAALIDALQNMIASSQYQSLIKEGIRTVIMGEPNAGKSSLLNALLGRERALVSPEPGTTRDYVEDQLHLGPYLLRIIDTAGLREHAGTVERLGIAKTIEQIEIADLIIWVVDGTLPHPTLPKEVENQLATKSSLIVSNKSDLCRTPLEHTSNEGLRVVPVSALTGAGISQLRETLQSMVAKEIDGIGPENIVISARHAHALNEAKIALLTAQELLRDQQPTELAATELRIAMEAMGEITGKIDNEQVLDELFASFCIGK